MFPSVRDRFILTKESFEYADEYEGNEELFDKGIKLLEDRIKEEDFSEFDEEERELLTEICYCIKGY